MILPVIMAGGSGSRLWPLSRQQFPKQFLTLLGNNSMLQTTAQRLKGIEHAPALVICNEEHRFSVAEQFRANAIKTSGIILEPVGRNTAPAIALAAMQALKCGEDPLLLVLAADHVIKDEAAFCASVVQAVPFAQAGKLVTFGIVPTAPETGYGYIKRGDEQGDNAGFSVAEFVEKPKLATAQEYLASGEYYWNSGMFLFKASTYLAELKSHRPDMFTACEQAMAATQSDLDFVRVDKSAFEACPDDSIDYAVMEKTTQAVVVPMDCGWSDVGSWTALWEVSEKDQYGNACRGDVINVDTRNTYVHASEKLVTTIGLDDVVVVETKDAILVAKQSEVQKVKKIVEQLKAEDRSEWQHHREVYRPWGKYDSIDNGERFQVKRITVKPGEKLSIQMHHHRAEHWIVVTGTAKVTNGDREILLTENQSTYIPVGVVHALENPGKVPLELIEVQSGSYLGEDDIVRFEDRYGRLDK
ncbi:mannose-1-phosphate guanylyltransferase/mannose-6-phosphate isomerase [Shewanella xiamenensis]|uniref:mannose-1-phosphate guanylyltransferase/mannose-6-phosphate isomerase n=1 Tax=Shewanella xiamenensis TaxID=332186 RepID=UPI001CC7658B|nr:mannose-1-phosphate guanylyltransferase/mannose-6-phosphate isomerase [Shewanella xiamenensis]BDA59929.1 mannose-1-phosphate guanylyltransferase 1 [Shewanella xiamenensis]